MSTWRCDLGQDLALEQATCRHVEEIFNLTELNRAWLRRWLPWLDHCVHSGQTAAHVSEMQALAERGTGFLTVILHHEAVIGVLGYNSIDKANRTGKIGYWINETHGGRGFMTRACAGLIHAGFESLGLNRQVITAAVENRPSRRVAERLGFQLEGISRDAEWLYDHYVDHAQYACLKREWRPLRS